MAFLKQLLERLDSQEIYMGLAGKYENRFKVNGVHYALIANTVAGNSDDNTCWMLEFENMTTHRIDNNDNDPKVAQSFAEAVSTFIKEKNPSSFYTYGSSIQSIKSILEAIKKKVKGYTVVDYTADQKDKETGELIAGNPIGKIIWTKISIQDTVPVVDTNDREAIVSDKFKPDYELPKDIKPNKAYMSGTSKSEKLDKGNKAYNFKAESFVEFKNKKLLEQEEIEIEPDDYDCFYSPSGPLGSKISVRCGGKFIGEFNTEDEALEAIRNWQDKNKWYPNIWFISDHGNYVLVDREGNEIKESVQEGQKIDILKKSAQKVFNLIKNKIGSTWKDIINIAGDVERLNKWLSNNKEEFIHAMDLVKQMTSENPKFKFSENYLISTFEKEVLSENVLDLILKTSPKVLTAAALIAMVMGSGQGVFAKSDSGEKALEKAKNNIEKIVEIVKEQGSKAGEYIQKGAEEVGKEVKKGAEEVGDSIQSKAQQIKKGFQQFMQQKKEEKSTKKPAVRPEPTSPQSKYKPQEIA